jgi:hypothetical protein
MNVFLSVLDGIQYLMVQYIPSVYVDTLNVLVSTSLVLSQYNPSSSISTLSVIFLLLQFVPFQFAPCSTCLFFLSLFQAFSSIPC